MTKKSIIKRTQEFVRKTLEGEGTGHDWFHVERVVRNALKIAEHEGGDKFIIELSALLHDIADWKFNEDANKGSKVARAWLEKLDADQNDILHVCEIIDTISFKGAGVASGMRTTEGKIIQDADRLDALGAIGIARTFAFNGWKGNQIYDPRIKPQLHKSFKQYKKSKGTAINHFYEKLLLLKGRINTKTGIKMAVKRHKFMESYLEQFYEEWSAKET